MNRTKYFYHNFISRFLRFNPSIYRLNHIYSEYQPCYYKNGIYQLTYEGSILHLRERSSDLDVFSQVIQHREYQFIKELHAHFFENDENKPLTIVDVGANIGLATLFFSKIFNIDKIICIEPDPGNIEILKTNIRFIDGAHFIQSALWNRKGNLSLCTDFRGGKAWSLRVTDQNNSHKIHDVPATTLQCIIDEFQLSHIDILKIDIEGAEKQVFLEDEAIAKALQIARLICIEIHQEFVSIIDFNHKMQELGFELYSAGGETVFCVNNSLKKSSFDLESMSTNPQ